jgi:transcriptional regulator with XRE-family HTH domain
MSDLLERINELQKRTQLTQKQVAKEAGISLASFTEWNKGKAKPSLDAVVKLAAYFNVSLDYLVLGKEATDESETKLENSNFQHPELVEKYNLLPSDMQARVLAYIDGMLAVLPESEKGTLLG